MRDSARKTQHHKTPSDICEARSHLCCAEVITRVYSCQYNLMLARAKTARERNVRHVPVVFVVLELDAQSQFDGAGAEIALGGR